MFRSTLIVSSLNLFSLVLAFTVNIIISSKFGAGFEMDSYSAAIALPGYIVTVLTGVLSYTFMPVFSQYKNDNPKEGWFVVNSFITVIFLFVTTLALLIIFFAPFIMKMVAPGFSIVQVTHSSELLRWYVPIIVFSSLNELIASIFYSRGNFAHPLLNKLINPLLTILFVYFLGSQMSVKSMVLASLIGSIIQFSVLWLIIRKDPEFNYKPVISFEHPGVKRIFKLMGPLLLSSILYKIFPVFDAAILSKLPEGSIASIGYASKLQLLVASVITSIFSIQVFSLFSDMAAAKEWLQLKSKISLFSRMLFFIAIPIAMFVFLFGDDIVRILFQRGSFTHNDTIAVASCLKIYVACLPAIAVGGIISQGLYVMQDTKAVMIAGIFEALFYIGICLYLVKHIGMLAVPVSYVLNFNLSVLVLALLLRSKLKLGGGQRIFVAVSKIAVLSAIICSAVYGIVKYFHASDILTLLLIMLGSVIYFFSAHFLKFKESTIVYEKFNSILSKIKK